MIAGAGTAPPADTPATRPVVFDVRTFGAAGDGKALDTAAINRAIDAASAAGGGIVRLPAGTYRSVSVHLRSNMTLSLERGATLLATAPADGIKYDDPEPNPDDHYQDFGHSHWHNSLLWGDGLENVAIVGPGTIRGEALVDVHRHPDDPANKAVALKRCRNVRISDLTILHGGHFAILATGVDHLDIDHVTIDTNRDGIDLDCCRDVRVSDCRVNAPMDDGICLKSSYALGEVRATENVSITRCRMSGYDEGSLISGTFHGGTEMPSGRARNGRIKFGTESNGGLKNLTIADCTFESSAGLAFETVDGGDVEDVTVINVTMRDLSTSPLFVRLGARLHGPSPRTAEMAADDKLPPPIAAERAYDRAMKQASERAAARAATTAAATTTPTQSTTAHASPPSLHDPRYDNAGALRRIRITNLTVQRATRRAAIVFSGIPDHAIEDVTLSRIRINYRGGGTSADAAAQPPEHEDMYPEPGMFGALPGYALYARHVRGLKVSDAAITLENDDLRPPFFLNDVTGALFDRVESRRVANAPTFRLRDVQTFEIRTCPGLSDTARASAKADEFR